jgi:LysR family transcriptional regulator (chromosome initiation inhibitor)
MLDYPLLEALSAVVREGSFERAARALNITASAVSQRVKLLEERLGVVLVKRAQPCVATAAGAPLCRHFEQVALLERELAERLPELSAVDKASNMATVRIAVNADSVETWFVRALSHFAARRQLLFDLVIEDQDHAAELLRAGSVHGAVTTLAEPIQGCRSVALGALRYSALCTPAFHARHFARGVTRSALEQAPCAIFNAKDALQHNFVRKLVRSEVNLPLHRIPNPRAFLDACVHGLAWGMNPEPMCHEHVEKKRLVELVPGRHVDVQLYWQSWRISSAWFEELSANIVQEARRTLRQGKRAARA